MSLANGVLYVAATSGQLYSYSSAPPFQLFGSLLMEGGGSQMLLQWPSVSDKNYDVWFATNLSAPFTMIASNLAATPPVNSYQTPVGPEETGYFRIEAR